MHYSHYELNNEKEDLLSLKNQAMREIRVQFMGQEDPLEKGIATHSSILAWRIPRTEEPGGL